MDLEKDGNLIEAGLWFSFTLILLARGLKAHAKVRKTLLVLSAAFLAFSVSDVVESHTGAWWTPYWLLIWKVACVVVFFFGFREYYKVRRSQRP
jgi:phosphoglycerol transferase MdoB-like AlkP superfamily enzyme